ncbi:MAG: transposase [Fidelibacterota bacterium]|nr:MAG: transposase [Candidatus Neomarinimicrobiota bacterium]
MQADGTVAPVSNAHKRRSIRLKEFDYTQSGAYYVTICSHAWESLFGKVVGDEVELSTFGRIVDEEWVNNATIRPYVELDNYVIMPNHIHGIVMIIAGRGTTRRAPTKERFGKPVSGSLPTIIRAFKSAATKQINRLRDTPGQRVWQRNYYEHIIRNDKDLNRIREYIASNPMKWQSDRYYPDTINATAA